MFLPQPQVWWGWGQLWSFNVCLFRTCSLNGTFPNSILVVIPVISLIFAFTLYHENCNIKLILNGQVTKTCKILLQFPTGVSTTGMASLPPYCTTAVYDILWYWTQLWCWTHQFSIKALAHTPYIHAMLVSEKLTKNGNSMQPILLCLYFIQRVCNFICLIMHRLVLKSY